MANFVSKLAEGKVPFPSHLDMTVFIGGGLDNFDHEEQTLSGLKGTHDTVPIVIQRNITQELKKPKILEAGISNRVRKFNTDLNCQHL